MRWLTFSVALAMLGCGHNPGNENNDLAGGGGGGGDDLSVIGDGGTPHPTAKIVATPDYAGLASQLDASGSTDPQGRVLTYRWHFQSVPTGSAIVDTALMPGATAKRPTFVSDLGGTYVVTLTVTAPDASSDTATAMVTVPTVPLFYYEGLEDAQHSQVGVGVMRSDGTGRRLLNCPGPLVLDAGVYGADNPYQQLMLNPFTRVGMVGLRVRDPATAGMPSHVAFLQTSPGTVSTFKLWMATDDSVCNTNPPVQIDDRTDEYTIDATHTFSNYEKRFPRFSPDGTRVVYYDVYETTDTTYAPKSRVVTVGIDGSNPRIIRHSTDASHGITLISAPPIWLNNTTVAWVEEAADASSNYQVILYYAQDAVGAGDNSRSVLLNCATADATTSPYLRDINQFELVAGGTKLLIAGQKDANSQPAFNTPAGEPASSSLYLMVPTTNTAAISSCDPTSASATVLVKEPGVGQSIDFAVSPDGTKIAFSSTHGVVADMAPTPQKDIFIMPIDGSSAPVKLAGSDPNIDDIGPRWVGGGKQIMWTQVGYVNNNIDIADPIGGGIMIANADGTNPRSLYAESTSGGQRRLVLGGQSRGCSAVGFGAGGAGGFGAALLAGGLLALALRRRRL